jgi:microcystin-dependent protein
VLLPNLTDSLRKAKKEAVSHGMLVFDRTQRQLYYYDSLACEWVAANPIGIVHRDNGFAEIRPLNDSINKKSMSVGLHKDSVATAKLDVNGNVRVRGNLRVDKNLQVRANMRVAGNDTVQNNLRVGGATTLQGAATINNVLTVNGNINASNQSIQARTLNVDTVNAIAGNGVIPLRGIIMWSGNTPPDGWALCNGSNSTPDLRGRFIVGYNPADGDYNAIGNTGGEKRHTLTIDEMPSHQHPMWLKHSGTRFTGGGDANKLNEADESEGTPTGATGGDSAHENRPPYYVLAFIMRVR